MSLNSIPFFIIALSLIGPIAQAESTGEAQFVIEYIQKNQSTPVQVIEMKESEKEKYFYRKPDHTPCNLKVIETTQLVASYRKIEVELQCQEPYTKSTTSAVCLFSEPQAPPAQLTEKKNKLKEVQLDLGDLPDGVEIKPAPNRKSRKRKIKLTPAWDASLCQSLGEGVDSFGGDKPRSRMKCCYSK
jgi:hypothetical protein